MRNSWIITQAASPDLGGSSMTVQNNSEQSLRMAFKYFNHFMLFMFRLGLGSWFEFFPAFSGRIMVITHTGRKSGQRRRTPVNYALVDGDVYCVAGFGKISDWYLNIKAHPKVEIWLTDSWWEGTAQDVTGCEQHIQLMRQVLIGSGFAAYAAGIDPHALSDEALNEVTKTYRLVRIQRTAPRTGPGGPGDLAWVWPLASMILLPLALRRRKRR